MTSHPTDTGNQLPVLPVVGRHIFVTNNTATFAEMTQKYDLQLFTSTSILRFRTKGPINEDQAD